MYSAIELANTWTDFALLDAGDGEKLERWGAVTVIRPDPQAIWPRSVCVDWAADMIYHRSKSGGGYWETLRPVPDAWTIDWQPPYDEAKSLCFRIRPTGFKHMGLFPEQAVNWAWMQGLLRTRTAPRVLNLFAYTGGATVACLAAGAAVTHIDASKGMNRWALDNVALSDLSDAPCRVLMDDVMKFVLREGRRGNQYDAIIMDPPVFGHGPGGELWKLEDKLLPLVTACAALLSPAPLFLLINAYTAGYSPSVYANVLEAVFAKQSRGSAPAISASEIGLPAASGIILPCGMYARATFV